MPQESLSTGHQSAANSGSSAKRGRRDGSEGLPPAKKARRIVADAYILIHTMGYTEASLYSGDGAYAEWLHRYFTDQVERGGDGNNVARCVAVGRLMNGVRGLNDDLGIESMVFDSFSAQFENILREAGSTVASTVIVDWHLRATGHPASWTGRGASDALIKFMRDRAKEYGLRFKLIYTVHEVKGAVTRMQKNREQNPFPYILALNPTVKEGLGKKLDKEFDMAAVAESRVPRLMNSLHTEVLDKVLHYAVAHDAIDEDSLSFTAAGTAILQRLRLANSNRPRVKNNGTGVLIFGTIEPRHGLNVEDLEYLAKALATMDPRFRIGIAGNTKDQNLIKGITNLAVKWPRIKLIGLLEENSLDSLSAYPYALSMDEQGYRSNASAMANVIGAGMLLFRRNGSGEPIKQLIDRMVAQITSIGASDSQGDTQFLRAIEKDFALMRASDPTTVGRRLNLIYGNLASGGRGLSTQATSG